MKPLCLAVVLLALADAPAFGQAQPPAPGEMQVKLPATLKAMPGQLLPVTAETAGKYVQWVCTPGATVFVPGDRGNASGKRAMFHAMEAGTYTVVATVVAGDEARQAVCVVTVGAPKPPAPADPLAATLQLAYQLDPSPNKEQLKARLAVVLRSSASYSRADKKAHEIKKLKDLLARLSADTDAALGGKQALSVVRDKVGDQLDAQLGGSDEQALTDDLREAAAAAFERLAAALEGVS